MSNSKNTSLSSYSIEEFQKYIDERIKKGIQNGSNLILTGTVEKSYPGGYDIKIENSGTNSIVLATSLTKDSYTKGDFILLIKSSIINSGASIDRYFILGKVGITVKDVQTLLENQIDFRIAGDTKRETFKENGYDFTKENQLIFSIKSKDALFKDAFLLGYLQISAMFTTEQKDNYGFLIEYYDKNDKVLKTQKIDTSFFVGNVYFQENYPQSGIIVIDTFYQQEDPVEKINISLFADRKEGIEIKKYLANNIAVAAGSYDKIFDKDIKVNISADKNGKDYFRGVNEEENIEDAITLAATTFFDAQELLTEDIDFYWEVQQENEWIVLNENQTEFIAKLNTNEIENFIKYKTKNISTLKITEKDDKYKYFQNYLTKIRCRIQYKTFESISEEFDVINYEKGNYSLSFSLKSGGSILTSTTDRVEIEAKIINNNSFIQDEELNIGWQWKIFAIEENGTVGTQNLGSSLIYDTIIIKNDEKTSIASREIEIPVGAVGVQCAVAAQLKDSNGETYLTLESNPEMPIIIRTDVSNNTEVRASTIYKYCLSSNMSLVFEEDSNSEVGWKPVDWTEYIEWKSLEEKDKEGITALDNMPIGANKYLYYTQATVWEKYNKHEFLSVEKTDPWTRPQLLRYVNLAGENITGAAVEQINTFNQLTNNGKEQGIFYDESQEDGKKLYINATFIQSGTLRVGDNTDERFYASLNDSVVRIGGWGVSANELISSKGTIGINSDDSSIENIAFWAGNEDRDLANFRVTHGGNLHATNAVIEGAITATSLTISSDVINSVGLATSDSVSVAQSTAETAQSIAIGAQSDAAYASSSAATAYNTAISAASVANSAAEGAKLNDGNYINTYFKIENDYIMMASNTLWLESNLLVINTPQFYLNYNPNINQYDKNGYCQMQSNENFGKPTPYKEIIGTDNLEFLDLKEDATVFTGYSCSVKGNGYSTDKTKVIIPTSYTSNGIKYIVNKIADDAFSGWTNLKNVTLTKNIRRIGSRAFKNCSFENIVFPQYLETIGENAFTGNQFLKQIVFCSEVTLEGSTMPECPKLEKVDLSRISKYSNLNYCFRRCTNLEYIDIPEGIETLIGTFDGCTNLKEVVLPETLKSFGYEFSNIGTFTNCPNLASIYYKGFWFDSSINKDLESSSFNQAKIYTRIIGSLNQKDGTWDYDQQGFVLSADLSNEYIFNSALFKIDSFGSIIIGEHPFLNKQIKITDNDLTLLTYSNDYDRTKYLNNKNIAWGIGLTGNNSGIYRPDGLSPSLYCGNINAIDYYSGSTPNRLKQFTFTESKGLSLYKLPSINSGSSIPSISNYVGYLQANIINTTGSLSVYAKSGSSTLELDADAITSPVAITITSDKEKKNNIKLQDGIYSLLFDKFKPVSFEYNNGKSHRIHFGLVAQDVEQALFDIGLTTQDFAPICYNIDENGEKVNYGIRYEELISMCIYEIQQNKKEIAELKIQLKEIKGE